MNFLEAIKDGRRFRRKGQKEWSSAIAQDRLQELLADDWEVEEKTVPLTASLFDSKASRVLDRCLYNTIDDTLGVVKLALADLKRELGL